MTDEKSDTEIVDDIRKALKVKDKTKTPLTYQYLLFGRWVILEKRPKLKAEGKK